MKFWTFTTAVTAGLMAGFAATAWAAPPATVIELTQVPCQFVESENGVDHGLTTTKSADCQKINRATGAKRLAEAKPWVLKPGRYEFRVTNKNVPYELGFFLREHDFNFRNPVHQLTKTAVSGGGLLLGMTKSSAVELKEGEYLYSCPLNPTPDYRLTVRK